MKLAPPNSKGKKKKHHDYEDFYWKNFSANDVLDPKDPDAPETGRFNADETTEDHNKTLDQYLEERKSSGHFPTLPEPRKPNEGVADSELKEAVPYRKESDNYFVGKVK